MQIVLLIPEYVLWHYTRALRLTLNIITNFIWFTYHFFSIPILLKTFLSPWYVVRQTQRPGFHPLERSEKMALAVIMGMFGPLIRAVTIVSGLTLCVIFGFIGLILFVVWLLLPFIVIGFIYKGFSLIFP